MEFSELQHLAKIKARPGMYLGRPSLERLRERLWGMEEAFRLCGQRDQLKYFFAYTQWYQENRVKDGNGYASWFNHMMYTSGLNDEEAFHSFFRGFERWLKEQHGLMLPDPS